MSLPLSTYRIQLHAGFALNDLQRIIEYLYTLGVTTIYASPVTQAAPGSMHGYDVTDPHSINCELGTAEELKAIIRELHKKEMGWLQDIVPNHMAFHPMNFRLMDVLERGPESPYYKYFDIDWNHRDADLRGKVMVPFLGDELNACISKQEISLTFGEDGFKIKYIDTDYPLSLPAYPLLASLCREGKEGTVAKSLKSLIKTAEGLSLEKWKLTRQEEFKTMTDDPVKREFIQELVARINADDSLLSQLVDNQYYKLTFWKETDRRINYRRFFTVNELICLRMEDEEVYNEYHSYLLKLHKDKLIDGFRIDHIDGLQDPSQYIQRLREDIGEATYLIAEKILEAKEEMPAQWPLHGTSGYEFLSILNRLLTHRKGGKELLSFYRELVPGVPPYNRLIFASKQLILENYMVGEWNNLVELFQSLRLSSGFSAEQIKSALGLFMLCLPVYRIYPDSLPVKGKSLLILHEAFEKALKEGPDHKEELDYLRQLFTNAPASEEEGTRVLLFLKRLMQFTGPLTAKGVEDTTFYIYNPLISHDEVGDAPVPLGMTIQRFHEKMLARQMATPLSLNATATHDTKRGEDSRVRLNVLSRIPELWKEHVAKWFAINASFRGEIDGRQVPEINDEYFIYQSLLGGFPEDFIVTEEWIERVKSYLNKALREAKVNSNWAAPDEGYEKSCEHFVDRILDKDHAFLGSFIPFVRTVCEHAMVYTLTQTLIKLTAPGIPDVYQGCELWDLSFVDPDNRRPVDFDKRMELLFQLIVRQEKGPGALFQYLRENREAGIEKLYIIWRTLNFRKARPGLFTNGNYIPVAITGDKITAAAFARSCGDDWVLVIFPFGLVKHEMVGSDTGANQFVVLPEQAPRRWLNLFTTETIEAVNQIPLDAVFEKFPVALLAGNDSSTSSETAP